MQHRANTLDKMPLIGLGTWKLKGEECTKTVRQALEMGYQHIDTALVYENHLEIGKALKEFHRSDVYLTSKLPIDAVDFSNTQKSVEELCDRCLKELNTDYLDLFLIHSPDHEVPMEEVIFAMESLRSKGKIKHIGVSNFTIHHMQNLLHHQAYFAFNQVEFHPYLFQKELLDFCLSHHVKLVAYRPFGKGELLNEPLFQFIGKKKNKSPSQVILRWLVQRNIPVIPKASSKEHLQENLAVFDFTLTEEEMVAIDALHRGIRYAMPDFAEFSY